METQKIVAAILAVGYVIRAKDHRDINKPDDMIDVFKMVLDQMRTRQRSGSDHDMA